MVYVQGFAAAVPTARKQEYADFSLKAHAMFKRLGAVRYVECWGDDVPKGTVNDFFTAVQCKDDETPVFSWIEYPDKATYEAAIKGMMEDPEMEGLEMPFDGQRMIYGGFEVIVDEL
ncbi:DUF1428 domain-containing protein [Pelagibacterium montanilacus]|uniref:DUF1428 domain-containing protein n=1 Tax=Pelagibacterium montanilacus TaxID=2185280 RepID=UPI000F8CB580|nr:DUF1428 family protein [Pelagibacterium montanilacus]